MPSGYVLERLVMIREMGREKKEKQIVDQ